MYAIVADGGRQFKVEEGQELLVDYRDLERGSQIVFDRVLARGGDSFEVGRPVLAGVTVTAEVLGAELGPKLVVQKMRRRKTFRRKTGHRQLHTRVRVTKIEVA